MEGQRPGARDCALGYLPPMSSVPWWEVGIHTGRPPNNSPGRSLNYSASLEIVRTWQ